MRQTDTDHNRVHRPMISAPGCQFALDAYTHGHKSLSGFKHADILTDLATRRIYPVFTKDRSAQELCVRMISFFNSHPEWKNAGSTTDRFIRTDPEKCYESDSFQAVLAQFGYRREPTAPRDKHANGVAERSVGLATSKTNVAMLAPFPNVPHRYWDFAMDYACTTLSLNLVDKIHTSPYFLITGRHVNVKHLHRFWCKVWVHIAVKDRAGKLGYPCAYPGRFLGYDRGRLLEPRYRVLAVNPNGSYGVMRISKDVLFDDTIDFKDTNLRYPKESEFITLNNDEQDLDQASGLHNPIIPEMNVPILNPTPPQLPRPIPIHPHALHDDIDDPPDFPIVHTAIPQLPDETLMHGPSPVALSAPKSILKHIAPARKTTALPRQDARPLPAKGDDNHIKWQSDHTITSPNIHADRLIPTLLEPIISALPVQLPAAEEKVVKVPKAPPDDNNFPPGHLTRSQRRPVTYKKITRRTPSPPPPDNTPANINKPVLISEEGDAVYWYSYQVQNFEYNLSVIETSHFLTLSTPDAPTVPKAFWKAMKIPEWKVAIDIELTKFETNACLEFVPYTGQHLVPMMWLFNVKNDGTKKARLVGRGDLMIPLVDFDPDAVYCGNVAACSVKIVITISAMYKLVMKGGDLVGAYLITRASKAYPVFITGTLAYDVPEGFCIQAVGNLYGFPPAGQNFSKEFDKCLAEAGYKNTPWDLKLFFKWTPEGKPMMVIAHSGDFRWFGPQENIHEWTDLINTFNRHGYEVTDATDKEFVGIRITRDEDFNYYMDQHRMIDSIIKEANMTGAKDEHLPYPSTAQQPPLTKQDCASTPEERDECSKYPYRRVVGQLMYGMVHTMVAILFALNILSRYGANPGPRHILFLKHLLRYIKYSKNDRLMFKTHPGPWPPCNPSCSSTFSAMQTSVVT